MNESLSRAAFQQMIELLRRFAMVSGKPILPTVRPPVLSRGAPVWIGA
ncbi:MAG: hypothetical protein ACRD0W_08190 [Acidimicrobiales bacterium]